MMTFLVMKLCFAAEIGKIISRERMVSVCPKEGTVFLGGRRLSMCTVYVCVRTDVCSHGHACTCIRTH